MDFGVFLPNYTKPKQVYDEQKRKNLSDAIITTCTKLEKGKW